MIKEPIIDVMVKLRKMDFQVMKDNLLLHRSTTSTKNWNHVLGFTSKTLKIGEQNLRQLVEYGSYLKPTKKYSPNYHKTMLFYQRLVKNNQRMLINAITYRLHAIMELEEQALKKEFVVIGNSEDPIKELNRILKLCQSKLLHVQKGIYGSVFKSVNATDLSGNCFNDTRALIDLMDSMAKIQTHYKFILQNYKSKKIKNNVKKLGLALARLNSVIRETIATVASTHCLMYLCNGIKVYNYKKELELISKIESLPFSITYPDGKNIAVKEVAKMKENAFVEVQGFIDEIETVQTKEKGKCSVITIHDISTDTYAKAFLPFSNLAANGISKGAYCNLNGRIKHQSEVVADETSIHIDQLNLTDKNTRSWKDVFFSLSKPVYMWKPNNANLIWSTNLSNPKKLK